MTIPFLKTAGVVWLEHALENALGAGATAALTVWGAQKTALISSVPWQLLASAAALGAFASLLKACASLSVSNGTASINPHVVADKIRKLRL
jgi:hypothetical protein